MHSSFRGHGNTLELDFTRTYSILQTDFLELSLFQAAGVDSRQLRSPDRGVNVGGIDCAIV